MTLDEIDAAIEELGEDFETIQMPRSAFVLDKMVVAAQDHPAMAWTQCVLELQIKYNAIRRARIRRKILEAESERLLASDDEIDALRAEEKRIDIEEQDLAVIGARREFEALYQIYKSFGRRWNRDELEAAQPEYWQRRLTRQAGQEFAANGRVGPGNQEALRQIGVTWQVQPGQLENLGNGQLNAENRRFRRQ